MRRTGIMAFAACSVFLAGCSTSSPYLFTVVDRASARAIEGATIEVTREAERTPAVTATTDGRGESVVVLARDARCYLVVTFDGTSDRYLVRSELVPAWNAPKETLDDPNGALRFMSGTPSSSPAPAWAVRVVRLK